MENGHFIGVFDSGVGGISVLRHLVSELPHESFRFFGDSANAPYGDKSRLEIRALSERIVDDFLSQGAKAIVIACNTATSASASYLREKYADVPIVGVEPALKPAALLPQHDRILVMATAATLRLEKFHHIEKGDLDSPEIHDLLESLLGRYRGKVDSVVLGCTHYPFIRRQIADVVGDVPLLDGGEGTAHQLRRLLAEHDLLAGDEACGGVEFSSSLDAPGELDLYRKLFSL